MMGSHVWSPCRVPWMIMMTGMRGRARRFGLLHIYITCLLWTTRRVCLDEAVYECQMNPSSEIAFVDFDRRCAQGKQLMMGFHTPVYSPSGSQTKCAHAGSDVLMHTSPGRGFHWHDLCLSCVTTPAVRKQQITVRVVFISASRFIKAGCSGNRV